MKHWPEAQIVGLRAGVGVSVENFQIIWRNHPFVRIVAGKGMALEHHVV